MSNLTDKEKHVIDVVIQRCKAVVRVSPFLHGGQLGLVLSDHLKKLFNRHTQEATGISTMVFYQLCVDLDDGEVCRLPLVDLGDRFLDFPTCPIVPPCFREADPAYHKGAFMILPWEKSSSWN